MLAPSVRPPHPNLTTRTVHFDHSCSNNIIIIVILAPIASVWSGISLRTGSFNCRQLTLVLIQTIKWIGDKTKTPTELHPGPWSDRRILNWSRWRYKLMPFTVARERRFIKLRLSGHIDGHGTSGTYQSAAIIPWALPESLSDVCVSRGTAGIIQLSDGPPSGMTRNGPGCLTGYEIFGDGITCMQMSGWERTAVVKNVNRRRCSWHSATNTAAKKGSCPEAWYTKFGSH